MSIPLYGAEAQGPHIYALDDQALVVDGADLEGLGGSTYDCTMRTVPFAASAYSRLRRLVQSIPHDGAVTVAITPWRDDSETGQTVSRVLASSDPHLITVPLSVTGSEFQLAIVVTGFESSVDVGTGQVTVTPRRSQR